MALCLKSARPCLQMEANSTVACKRESDTFVLVKKCETAEKMGGGTSELIQW